MNMSSTSTSLLSQQTKILDLPHDVVVSRFIDAYFKTHEMDNVYVPEVILSLICEYINISELHPNPMCIHVRKSMFSGIEKRLMGRFQRMNKATFSIRSSTPILFSSMVKIYSRTRKYESIGIVLTPSYIYFVCAVNYQTWNEFKHRSKINELTSGKYKVINQTIARQLIRNLEIVDNERLKTKILVPQLTERTIANIVNSIILSEQVIPSLLALFGAPKLYIAIDLLQTQSKEYKYRKYKVYQMSELRHVTEISDLEIMLKFLSVNIKCKVETANIQKQLVKTLNEHIRKDLDSDSSDESDTDSSDEYSTESD
eukprot:373429_1